MSLMAILKPPLRLVFQVLSWVVLYARECLVRGCVTVMAITRKRVRDGDHWARYYESGTGLGFAVRVLCSRHQLAQEQHILSCY